MIIGCLSVPDLLSLLCHSAIGEVAPPLVPVKELTRSLSPSSMLPEAVCEALGISLSGVLNLYFRELDEVRRGRLI
jgi:hypothetical protein